MGVKGLSVSKLLLQKSTVVRVVSALSEHSRRNIDRYGCGIRIGRKGRYSKADNHCQYQQQGQCFSHVLHNFFPSFQIFIYAHDISIGSTKVMQIVLSPSTPYLVGQSKKVTHPERRAHIIAHSVLTMLPESDQSMYASGSRPG